ncbi:DUF4124 domain-containing protein [Uliginosibacterium sp. H3]|uniref:DUF4124 domain-containing protein n=1 Tax=Uliginosibacterium silvisoli TaxID=3114758 RepID=A0ABU6K661_9RHOO|nr:DUF4124 domain-containing protein [Uliginosibacterium sp. H3]
MWQRVIFLLLICASAAGFYLWQTPAAFEQVKGSVVNAVAVEPAPLYKWTDKNGQVTYGSTPPTGAKAQQVDESKGSVSVVPAAKVPPAMPKLDEAQSDPRSIRQRALERAVDGS